MDVLESCEERLPGREVAYVVLERARPEVGRDPLGAVDVDVRQRDVEAVGDEPARDRLADPTRGARDDRRRHYGSGSTGSPTATRPGSTTSHQTPNGRGSLVGTPAR